MKYYRVRKHADQFPKNPKVRDGNIFIADELYTTAEFNKLQYVGYSSVFEIVDIPKNKTYWCFGARFAAEEEL